MFASHDILTSGNDDFKEIKNRILICLVYNWAVHIVLNFIDYLRLTSIRFLLVKVYGEKVHDFIVRQLDCFLDGSGEFY